MSFSHRIDDAILKAADVVGQLGVAIGIPDLSLEEDSCTLSLDGLPVTLELDAPHHRFVVSCFIADDADDADDARRYRSLLEGSLEGVVDGTGMVFGLDTVRRRIVMATALLLDDVDGADLAAALSRFVARAEAWRSRLGASAEAGADNFGTSAPSLLAPDTRA